MPTVTRIGTVLLNLPDGWQIELLHLRCKAGETWTRGLVCPTERHCWAQMPRLSAGDRRDWVDLN